MKLRQPTSTNQADNGQFASSYSPVTEHRAVFQVLLIGTFILIAVVSVLLFISYFLFQNTYVVNRIIFCAVALVFLAITYGVWTQGRRRLGSQLLILFYFIIATVVLLSSGVNNTFGLLIFAIGIILSGILLGARQVLLTASITTILIFAIQTFITVNQGPLFATTGKISHFGDAIAYSALLAILALISWLFGRQTERLFAKNKLAELALIKEKELLEIRVKERTQELQKAQLAEMEQLYQFAEMGQMSAALLHNLANQLSVLNFDIAGLKENQHSQAVRQVEESVAYLEQVTDRVRKQLQGKSEPHAFDVATCLEESLKIIGPKITDTHTAIVLEAPETTAKLYGDPIRLSHVLGILAQNAIESYKPDTPPADRKVIIAVEQAEDIINIRVRDFGSGISKEQRRVLFAPFSSTKKDGLGIGLFIAKKIVETHFKGSIELNEAAGKDTTEFVIKLPKSIK